MKEIPQQIKQVFIERYSTEPLLVQSPGRINLIGEHTDYNEGFVLPASINKYVYIAIQKREDNEIVLWSQDFLQEHKTNITSFTAIDGHWSVYILGVVNQLLKKNYTLGGFNLVIQGDVPLGAGMSSSAAVECASIFALTTLFNIDLPKMELVKMAQLAEHEFAGVKCGIMDQFASMFGKKDCVIQLDCRSLEYTYFPFNIPGISIVLFDTGVKHSLATSAYNVRRQQCETGVSLVKAHHPEIKSLRDVSVEMLDKYVLPKDELVYQRCKYVVEEMARLKNACVDLENDNLTAFGQKMFATHDGLSKLYEVSCKELDFLVDSVRDSPAVLGARMMGGGFGGCTINLIKDDSVDAFVQSISQSYQQQMHIQLKAYVMKIENGTSLIEE